MHAIEKKAILLIGGREQASSAARRQGLLWAMRSVVPVILLPV
jgi:hypothetical protein